MGWREMSYNRYQQKSNAQRLRDEYELEYTEVDEKLMLEWIYEGEVDENI